MHGTTLLSRMAGEVLDLLYPPGLYCICCGKITDDSRTYAMCNDCMHGIRWTGGSCCLKCGKVLSDNDSFDTCFYCRNHEHSFDKGYACAEYGMHEKTLLYELKYSSRGDIADVIGEIMYDRMSAEFGAEELQRAYDMVVPIPIFRGRKNRRGFNQAEIIAESFCRRAKLRCENDLLTRVKETAPMKGLGPQERKANIEGAFGLRERKRDLVRGRRILIIDDIFTTGATIDEAASTLKTAGAAEADSLVFAAGADIIHA